MNAKTITFATLALSGAMIYIIAANQSSYALTSASLNPAASEVATAEALPESEYFQLNFPISQTMLYSSYVDHHVVNGFYQRDQHDQSYTGEDAQDSYHAVATNIICYDYRTNGREFCYDGHSGLDIPVATATPVYAAHAGYVAYACNPHIIGACTTGYGRVIMLQDKYNTPFFTLYGHNQQVIVAEYSYVARGQQIAESGSTGAGTAAHLHFGVYVNLEPNELTHPDIVGKVVDPYGWFSQANNGIGGPINYYLWASGYPPPTNSITDTVNWNEGTIISQAYKHKDKSTAAMYYIGRNSGQYEDPIEDWWANHYGSPGVAIGGVYHDYYNNRDCQEFEGGTYCTDGSYNTVSASYGAFTDTPYDHWAHRYIGWAHREGVFNGYNDAQHCGSSPPCFLPDQFISRAELAVIMVAGFNLHSNNAITQHYCDVQPNDCSYNAVETLYGLNIMRGQPSGSGCIINGYYVNLYFYPNSNIRRSELTRVIVQFGLIYPQSQSNHWIPTLYTNGGPDYCDVPDTNHTVCQSNGYEMWYDYVETLYNYGIIAFRREIRGAGSGGLFRPNQYASRAQIAMFFHELVYARGNVYHPVWP